MKYKCEIEFHGIYSTEVEADSESLARAQAIDEAGENIIAFLEVQDSWITPVADDI